MLQRLINYHWSRNEVDMNAVMLKGGHTETRCWSRSESKSMYRYWSGTMSWSLSKSRSDSCVGSLSCSWSWSKSYFSSRSLI